MRRERPHLPDELRRRPRQVELPVGGRDLLGVGGPLARLWGESDGQRVEQARRHLCGAVIDGAGIVVGPDREGFLRGDRPGVQLLDELDDRHAGLRVARHDRALDRRRPAPARQQRRVHVQPLMPIEQRPWDDQAVGDRDDRLRRQLDRGIETLGLQTGHAETFSGQPRGRRC